MLIKTRTKSKVGRHFIQASFPFNIDKFGIYTDWDEVVSSGFVVVVFTAEQLSLCSCICKFEISGMMNEWLSLSLSLSLSLPLPLEWSYCSDEICCTALRLGKLSSVFHWLLAVVDKLLIKFISLFVLDVWFDGNTDSDVSNGCMSKAALLLLFEVVVFAENIIKSECESDSEWSVASSSKLLHLFGIWNLMCSMFALLL